MKKMMVALVGIVSVLMLASCHMEVDNDVSLEKTSYDYRYDVTGTASYIEAEWNSATKTYKAKEGAKSVECVANVGELSWDNYKNTNKKTYDITIKYVGDTEKEDLAFYVDLIEYKGKFYLEEIKPEREVTVTESLEDESFTVKSNGVIKWKEKREWLETDEGWVENTMWVPYLYTLDLNFTR